MSRKKLRNCSRCGVRHGPPIGTRCKKANQEFDNLNEEMDEGRVADVTDVTGNEKVEAPTSGGQADAGEAAQGNTEEGAERQLSLEEEDEISFSEFRRRREEERRACRAGNLPSPPPPPVSGSGAYSTEEKT